MSYAENTKVSTSRTQEEIRNLLTKHEATGFVYGEGSGNFMVMFEMVGKRFKFVVPLPDPNDRSITIKRNDGWQGPSESVKRERIAQATRQRWRALLLVLKAKLECVESGITTMEQEFMAHIVLPNGNTVGQQILPQIAQSYRDGKMPPLLGYSA